MTILWRRTEDSRRLSFPHSANSWTIFVGYLTRSMTSRLPSRCINSEFQGIQTQEGSTTSDFSEYEGSPWAPVLSGLILVQDQTPSLPGKRSAQANQTHPRGPIDLLLGKSAEG